MTHLPPGDFEFKHEAIQVAHIFYVAPQFIEAISSSMVFVPASSFDKHKSTNSHRSNFIHCSPIQFNVKVIAKLARVQKEMGLKKDKANINIFPGMKVPH